MVDSNTNLTFSQALDHLKQGKKLARAGWNGKGMFIYQTIGNIVSKDFIQKFASIPSSVKMYLLDRNTDVIFNESITMLTATGQMQPGWLASQMDLLAEDWYIVE